MKFSQIPRGLVVFLGGILAIVVLVLFYQALFAGSSSSVSSSGSRNGFFSSLFPFGNPSPSAPAAGIASSSPLSQNQAGSVSVLREVSSSPVAGGWFATNPASTSTPLIRYMDRESGHITATPADSLAETRISNTTIPGMTEVYAASGSTIIMRSWSDGKVKNFYGEINATSSGQSIAVSSLPAFARVAVGNGDTVFAVTQANGGARADISKADGTKRQTVFSSPFSSWVPLVGGDRLFLATAPTGAAAGYLYELKSGSLSLVAGGAPGLMARISPSGRYVAYSTVGDGGMALSVIDTTTGAASRTPAATLAAKCAWVTGHEPLLFCAVPQKPPPAMYPDDWFLGSVSFSDNGWIVNPEKTTAYFIGTLADQGGRGLDAENVSIDASGSYALFMNKSDLSLWSLWIGDVVARALR